MDGKIEWFSSSGTYKYNKPKPGGNWWLVIECDTEIGRYYRHLYTTYCIGFQRPIENPGLIQIPYWPTHISVIKRISPPENKKPLWGKYEGKKVEFLYNHRISNYGSYFATAVICLDAARVVRELGLFVPPYPFHMTVGNTKNL